MRGTLEERFWAKVDRGSRDECWEWLGGDDGSGYGVINVSGNEADRAHRVSWKLHRASIPAGMCVLHHCDNRRCVNPAHLFIGTRADNIHDMNRKGRARHPSNPGESNPAAKLTQEDVREIRTRYAAGGIFQHELASDYNVHPHYISRIVRRERWAYLD